MDAISYLKAGTEKSKKMKQKIVIGFGLILTLLVATSLFATVVNGEENQLQPQITNMANQRMLVLTMRGNPEKVSKNAFQELFQTFDKHAGDAARQAQRSPRARWSLSVGKVEEKNWIAKYALPISENFPVLKDPNISIEVWEYGIVVQLMREGTYPDETKDNDVLKSFIARNGYAITGDHEEEYLIGSDMFFKNNPNKYPTLIRYRVERVGEAPGPIVKNTPKEERTVSKAEPAVQNKAIK